MTTHAFRVCGIINFKQCTPFDLNAFRRDNSVITKKKKKRLDCNGTKIELVLTIMNRIVRRQKYIDMHNKQF